MDRTQFLALATLALSLISGQVVADLSPEMHRKAELYKVKLSPLSTNQSIIKAVMAYNSRPSGLNNKRWVTLPEDSSEVQSFLNTNVAKMMVHLEKDSNIEMVFIRAMNGDLVAGGRKPALFNVANRPFYKTVLNGESWYADKLQPHPLTGDKSLVLAIPIRGTAGSVVGFVHAVIKE